MQLLYIIGIDVLHDNHFTLYGKYFHKDIPTLSKLRLMIITIAVITWKIRIQITKMAKIYQGMPMLRHLLVSRPIINFMDGWIVYNLWCILFYIFIQKPLSSN